MGEALAIFPGSASAIVQPDMANVEAEAALLGAVLCRNELLGEFGELSAHHFYEPLHQRIFGRISQLVDEGSVVTPITLRPYFERDEAILDLGGVAYLARLSGNGEGLLAPRELAGMLRDLSARRTRAKWLRDELEICSDCSFPLGDVVVPTFTTSARPLHCLDLAALADIEPKPKEFVVQNLFPAGEVALFTGAGAVGKSLLAQQIATGLAAGVSTLGLDLRQAAAIYLTCEDDADQLHWRQAHICTALGVPMASIADRLHLLSLRGELANALAVVEDGEYRPSPLFSRVAALVRKTGARLVFLDNVAHLFPGNENDRGDVTKFINVLNRLAGETGAAVVLLGHPNKSGDSYSGSTGWPNSVRSHICMIKPDDAAGDEDVRAVSVGKPNYTRAGEVLRFRWLDWAFVRDEDLPEDRRFDLIDVAKAHGEDDAFLRCLASCTSKLRNVSHIPGANHAPKVFAGMTEGKGFDKKAFERAMERLIHMGAIELAVPLWQDASRHWKYGIRLAQKCGDPLAATPCGDLRQPPAETRGNTCGDLRAATPIYTTYIEGGAPEAPSPSEATMEGASDV